MELSSFPRSRRSAKLLRTRAFQSSLRRWSLHRRICLCCRRRLWCRARCLSAHCWSNRCSCRAPPSQWSSAVDGKSKFIKIHQKISQIARFLTHNWRQRGCLNAKSNSNRCRRACCCCCHGACWCCGRPLSCRCRCGY